MMHANCKTEWGLTGVSTHKVDNPIRSITPEHPWTAKDLTTLVGKAVRDRIPRGGLKAKSSPKNYLTKEVKSNGMHTAVSASATNLTTNPIQGRRPRESDTATPSLTADPVHSGSQNTSMSAPDIGRANVDEEKGLIR